MANYVVSKETWYDEDKQLYYRYIGRDDSKKTLMYTAWGKTECIADLKAQLIVSLLNKLSIDCEISLS